MNLLKTTETENVNGSNGNRAVMVVPATQKNLAGLTGLTTPEISESARVIVASVDKLQTANGQEEKVASGSTEPQSLLNAILGQTTRTTERLERLEAQLA